MGWLTRALVGVTGGREPHVATTSKVFTAVFGGSSTNISEFDQNVGRVFFDCVILDSAEREIQIMYKGKYTSGGEASPPVCFSDNGIGPSQSAPQPQAANCSSCQWRQFGTAINEAGKAIPRCTKKKRLVVLPLKLGYDTPLQFDIPPAALSNWRGFVKQLMDARVDELNVLVRVYMVDNDKGFLNFSMLGYVDQMIGPDGLSVIQYRAAQPDIASLARHGDQPIDPQTWRPELAGQVEPLTGLPSPQMVNVFTQPSTAVSYQPAAPAPHVPQHMHAAPPAVTYQPPAAPTYAPPAAPVYAPPAAPTYAPPAAPTYAPPAAAAPVQMTIEPDGPASKKKPGRPKKAPLTVVPQGAPTADEVMGSYGMAQAKPVGKDLSNRIVGALQTPIPGSE